MPLVLIPRDLSSLTPRLTCATKFLYPGIPVSCFFHGRRRLSRVRNMAGSLVKTSIVTTVIIAIFAQLPIVQRVTNLVWLGLAIGKTLQPISDFPYQCQRLPDPRLQACEDLWLSQATRQLFLACSDPAARSQWAPKYAWYFHRLVEDFPADWK